MIDRQDLLSEPKGVVSSWDFQGWYKHSLIFRLILRPDNLTIFMSATAQKASMFHIHHVYK